MTKARVAWKMATGCLLVCGSAASVWAEKPSVAQVLAFKPKQEGVTYTIPAGPAADGCTVELEKGQGKASGWVLKDGQGKLLRRFFDSNGDGVPDVWSYFKDGQEVYRETDTNGNRKADQYRWLNQGGSRWGIDSNEDGKIDSWRTISPEEASQELLQAVVTKDYARLQALLLTEAEIASLGLPAADATKLRDSVKNAQSKFQATLTKLNGLNNTTRWLHLELDVPACVPTEQTGAKADVLEYPAGLVLIETGGKNDWLQTGPLVQVNGAWRLADAPTAGLPTVEPPDIGEVADKDLQPLLEKLNKHDQKAPALPSSPTEPNREVVRYNTERADILEQIVAVVKGDKRDPWVRQVADSLSSAAQASPSGDKTAYERLVRLEEQVSKALPGSTLAAYVTFREMTADYATKLAQSAGSVSTSANEFTKVQEAWLERLSKFVTTYPKADDTADALIQLGMVSEFVGKEDQAKKWYQQLAHDFADRPQAAKANGALKRLELEGKVLDLTAPKLGGGQFDLASVRGKVVVIYYWATWNNQCVGDFAKLKLLLDGQAGKVELVAINLDAKAEEAQDFVKKATPPGTQLFQPGGLESPLAVNYGVLGLPNIFLVGKDGKVVSRTVQINSLEDEIKKQLK